MHAYPASGRDVGRAPEPITNDRRTHMTDRISRRRLLAAAAFIVPAFDRTHRAPRPLRNRCSGAPDRAARAAPRARATAVVDRPLVRARTARTGPRTRRSSGPQFGKVIDVACDWAAIGKAIASVTDAQI